MTHTSHFDQLLRTAAAQPDPQRLLFVFAAAELPDDATLAQRHAFEAGEGGALAPLVCVDKRPDELTTFAAFAAESREAGPPWQVLFAAALSGRAGQAPSDTQVDTALQTMVERVRGGMVAGFLAFDPAGEPLNLA